MVSDVFLDNLTKIYDRKNIFVQNGTEWLTYKFNIRKLYFEKIIKNDGSKNFLIQLNHILIQLNFYLRFLIIKLVPLKKQF